MEREGERESSITSSLLKRETEQLYQGKVAAKSSETACVPRDTSIGDAAGLGIIFSCFYGGMFIQRFPSTHQNSPITPTDKSRSCHQARGAVAHATGWSRKAARPPTTPIQRSTANFNPFQIAKAHTLPIGFGCWSNH